MRTINLRVYLEDHHPRTRQEQREAEAKGGNRDNRLGILNIPELTDGVLRRNRETA